MKRNNFAIGILELRGITASIEAADAMVKAASIRVDASQKIGNALIFIAISGEVAPVREAIAAGCKVAAELGELYASTVIANPADEIHLIIKKVAH